MSESSSLRLQPSNSAIILQYHHVADNTPDSTSTSVELFRQQMELLKKLKFKVLPLPFIINKLQRGESLPQRVVALSFDDAYINFFQNAWPILKHYNYPATLFVATSHISDEPTEFLSWSQLRLLSNQGISIGSHSDSHDFLARKLYLNNDSTMSKNIIADIQLSLDKIKHNLSINTKLFAYPYGEYSDALTSLVGNLELIGFGQQSGPIDQHSNFSALPRFPASNQFGSIESLTEKLFTIPFQQISFTPSETFVKRNPPRLNLNLADTSLQVQCFAPSQGAIPIVLDKTRSQLRLNIQALKKLPPGRSRYNCTAKAQNSFYYWFSHPWIIIEM